jgi:diguanylate cyclase (GGDEF)-like protein/PAS domain S-box-containing protein
MNQSVSLREQINRKLQRILNSYIIGTTVLVFLLAMAGIAGFHQAQLLQYEALISTKLSSELTALIREADSVGNSSVVWTGLSDSAGREAYLEPLLERINRSSEHPLDLLDYRGRDYIISKKSRTLPQVPAVALEKSIETAAAQANIEVTPQGHLLWVFLPVISPISDGVLGIMRIHVNLDQELKDLHLPADLRVRYGLRDDGNGLSAGSWWRPVKDVPIELDKFRIPFQIAVSQAPWSRVLLVLVAVCLLLLSGYTLLKSLRHWATDFSRMLTDRIDRLVHVTSRVATQGDVDVEDDGIGDEISTMFDAVRTIVQRQRSINQQLLVSSRVFEVAAEAILITDKEGCIANVNEALLRITGYQREDLIGKSAGLLYLSSGTEQEGRTIRAAVRQQGEWRGETHILTKERQSIPVRVSVSSMTDGQNNNLGNVAVISDIRDMKQAEARLRELIYLDSLTGLPNFRAFSEFMERKLTADQTQQDQYKFALLYIDLDHLQHINGTYGHEQGDQAIVQLARELQEKLPKPHFLCRRSGDEFIAVMDIPDGRTTDFRHLLERSLSAQTYRVQLGGHVGQASYSIGAAVYPEHADNAKDLLVLADSALLFSKESGRACTTWPDPEVVQVIQRRNLLAIKLREAIRDRVISPHYQPEIDLRHGTITGFEALARWKDPELGDISPAEFVPIAESQGLIDVITEVMLEKLMADLPRIRERFTDAKVAFNASPRLLADQKVRKLLESHLNDARSDHSGLILEVTESGLMESLEDATAQLELIMAMGVQIAIDDFGTGYSSLARLAHLPIHKLKIDQSFIRAMGNEDNTKVVSSIMALARTLELDVVAEGVENKFQRDMLLAVGCHKAQGFLFSRPLPLEQLLKLPQRLLLHEEGVA